MGFVLMSRTSNAEFAVHIVCPCKVSNWKIFNVNLVVRVNALFKIGTLNMYILFIHSVCFASDVST